ncbi:YybS family protein [Kurthia huakuii]|jgi:uncharacterized protein YybS (DUF2232 family)|uniref:YybS family protein n=1 Tax=Kurthia huakuii TaxID=1421019 RepID=UPI000494E594|nr:YybS family protein [Kurthia huakuii]MBM7700720.1 uncharacterized protein YybS (DUF2232 family) [Kurthia huakuii]
MPENSTRRLTHGAMMVAIFTVLLAASTYIPLFYLIAIWVLPLPLAWYSAKYNTGSSIAATIVAILLSFIVGGGLTSLPAAFIFAIIGLVIGTMIRLKKSKVVMFIATSGASLVTFAIVYSAFVKLLGIDVLKIALDGFTQSMELSRKMMEQAQLSAQQMTQFENRMDLMEKTVGYTMPSVVVFCVITVAFIVLSINLPLLKRLNVEVPKFKPFRYMQLPRSILWYYLITLTLSLFVRPEEGTYLYVAILNLSLVLSTLLALQGLSLIHFFIHEKGMPKGVAVIATIVAIPMLQFVSLIGLIDLGFNVRGFITGKTKK